MNQQNSTSGDRQKWRSFAFKGLPPHNPRECHKCMAGKRDHFEMTDGDRRNLCNALAAQGFDLEYLAHRYGVFPRALHNRDESE